MLGQVLAQVEEQAGEARQSSLRLAQARHNVEQWKRDTLGSPGGLAWSFAAGALVGAKRPAGTVSKGAGRSVISVANLVWLATQLASKSRDQELPTAATQPQ